MSRSIFTQEERKVDCILGKGTQPVQELWQAAHSLLGAENARVAAAWRQERLQKQVEASGLCWGGHPKAIGSH